jgi:hypothetical protein
MEIKPGNFHWSSPKDYRKMIKKGNIITIDGDPVLVDSVEDDYIHWKDLENKRISGGFPIEKKTRRETCWNCYQETDEGVRHSSDCKICDGTGIRTVEYGGLYNVKIVAKDKHAYKVKQVSKELKRLAKKYKKLVESLKSRQNGKIRNKKLFRKKS